jgi:hypothetical protein
MTMERRTFLAALASAPVSAAPQATAPLVRWTRDEATRLYTQAHCRGTPLVFRGGWGLLTARVNPEGACQVSLAHRLLRSGRGGEDILEAEVTIRNTSSEARTLEVTFATSAHPTEALGRERAHLPFTAGPHAVLRSLGKIETLDCDRHIGRPGENSAAFGADYLEPFAGEPAPTDVRRMLLVPLADIYHPEIPWRIALFASPLRAWRVAATSEPRGEGGWTLTAKIDVPRGVEVREKCYLFVHEGDARAAWRVFHEFAFPDREPRPGWLEEAVVHYYDFLGPGDDGRRGTGYDLDVGHFREFHVGMATQHGYYPVLGDYLKPGRDRWLAMASDRHGGYEMSVEKIRARVKATRVAGTKAAIYLHTAGFDSASPYAGALKDAQLTYADGKTYPYAWQGPETVGELWHMSIASETWRKHLLEQARHVMEMIGPDAIVLDESFGGLGYDFHPDRRGPLAPHMIGFMRELRGLVHSFGKDKALLTSDCALASFVMWADGEGGDHAYASLLGNELYRKTPVRYTAALGPRRWLPCAWQFTQFWKDQMDLARKTGAGVGVSNGWIEYTGLHRLHPNLRARLIADIRTLAAARAGSVLTKT